MKTRTIAGISAALVSLSLIVAPAHAAGDATTVNVALLDMSAVMGNSMMGQGWNMMGNGQGMMGHGMMGMGMMSIRLDHATVKAGNIHFAVINWSRAMVHEMLLVAAENPNAPLPYDYGAAKVAEEQIKSLGEVDKLEANGSGSLDVKQARGNMH